MSSILASALNLAPSKDTFWTTERQPGNPLYPDTREPYPLLEALVATLSTGPVGPGDKINDTDVLLMMMSCDGNGRLLKPSHPATAIDKQIIKAAIPSSGGPDGEVWTSYTTIVSDRPRDFGILMAANLSSPYTVKFSDTGFPESLKSSLVFPFGSPEMRQQFDDDHPLVLSNCTQDMFCLYYFSAPETGLNGTSITIFGETVKWVPISPGRVTNIVHAEINMRVGIRGKPGEEVTMVFLIDNLVRYSTCKISTSGTAILDAKYGCFPNHPTSSQPTSVAPTSLTTNYSMTTEMIQSSTSHSSASGVVHQKGVLLFSVWLSTTVLMVKAMY